ncbi:MAG: MOSC domain-containing protein, partial [Pseudomonadota bacterium]
MKVVSVNIGKIQTQPWRDGTPTAIHKSAVTKQVAVTKFGLEGDQQADSKNHGGEDKAVFVMPDQNYAHFDIDQPFGFLGENLTLSGLEDSEVALGD